MDSHLLHRKFSSTSEGRNCFFGWSQIEPSADGTWRPGAQVELEPFPLGFGFYIGFYMDFDAGELAIPYPLLLGLSILPAGAYYIHLRRQKQNRGGGFSVSVNSL
jgi:hypothetical protein